MKPRIFTKKPMVYTSVYLPQATLRMAREAAAREGVSQCEFLRAALREKARAILDADKKRRK